MTPFNKLEFTHSEVRESPEGGFEARALGAAIFTEADSVEALRSNVVDAVKCHFDPGTEPKAIRLILEIFL